MRKVSIVIALCFVLAVALTVVGQGRDADAIMKAVQPIVGGLGAKVNAGDAAGVAEDAAKLQGLFAEAQAHFTKEKMQGAADLAKAASETAGNAAKAAKAGTVDKAAKNLGINCKGCHDMYREKAADGTFVTKRP